MRILFLTHRVPYPPNKGEKIRAWWEIKTLAQRHEVDLFTFYDDPNDAKHFDAVRAQVAGFYAEFLPAMRSRWNAALALVSGRPFSVGYFGSRTMQARVNGAVRQRSYDVAFAYSSPMAQYIMHFLGRRVVDLVDVDSDKWAQYAERRSSPLTPIWRSEARRLRAFEGEIIRNATHTVVCTEAERRLLGDAGVEASHPGAGQHGARMGHPLQVGVLHHPVDVSQFRLDAEVPAEAKALAPYVIFTGSMDYAPNVDAAVYFAKEIFPLVRAQCEQVRFVIAGRNPHRNVLRLAADAAIVVTGAVENMAGWLKGASVSVAPLRMARGVQNKVLEAMAMGLPVVTTTKVAQALPPLTAANLQQADDPRAFAEAVVNSLRAHSYGSCPNPAARKAVFEDFAHARCEADLLALVNEPTYLSDGAATFVHRNS